MGAHRLAEGSREGLPWMKGFCPQWECPASQQPSTVRITETCLEYSREVLIPQLLTSLLQPREVGRPHPALGP
jgi:hypothetical protein